MILYMTIINNMYLKFVKYKIMYNYIEMTLLLYKHQGIMLSNKL